MLNTALLKNPANYFVIWTMAIIGWFLFRIVQRGLPAISSEE